MPFITLLSDFGLHDPSVAIVKGILMTYTSDRVVDISHEIKPFNISQAAYLLSASYKNFPEGTCHLLLFDLFSDTTPRLLLSAHNNHYFLYPDNGLLPMVLGTTPENTWLCYELNSSGNSFIDWLHAAGNIIQRLSKNDPDNLGLAPYTLKTKTPGISAPHTPGTQYEILHIDHYGNVVVNVTRSYFQHLVNDRPFRIQFMQVEEINEISNNYSSVKE